MGLTNSLLGNKLAKNWISSGKNSGIAGKYTGGSFKAEKNAKAIWPWAIQTEPIYTLQ